MISPSPPVRSTFFHWLITVSLLTAPIAFAVAPSTSSQVNEPSCLSISRQVQFETEDSQLKIIGQARHPDNHQLLYCELHYQIEGNRIRVDYLDSSGEKFAQKRLKNNNSPLKPKIVQTDLRSGEKRVVAKKDDHKVMVQYQRNRDKTAKESTIPYESYDAVDAGFDEWIKQYWDELVIRKKRLPLPFLSIPHRKVVTLRVASDPKCEPHKMPSNDDQCFTIDFSNPLLNLVTPPIQLRYNQKRQLLNYTGLTNLNRNNGKPYLAEISYRHFDIH